MVLLCSHAVNTASLVPVARSPLGQPEDWSAALLRGLCTGDHGVEQAREGIVALNRVVAAGVAPGWAYELRGRLLDRVGQEAAGLEDIEKSIALEPGEPSPLVARALIRQSRGELRAALRDLDLASDGRSSGLGGSLSSGDGGT